MEAAAHGIPSIVSDACAAREYVEHGVTGLWFRSGDFMSLAEGIKLLKDNDNLTREMGAEAYKRFWSNPPNREAHISKLINCYSEVLTT
ncbi:Glycosyl transferases group 1 [compost metagenome]